MSTFALVVTALVLAGRTDDPLNQGDAIDVVGWSTDEARLAVRWFELADPASEEEQPDCPGYVDQSGKPFRGALTLAAYEGTRLIQSWLIQDYPTCTPPADARASLKEAKAAIAKLGITLNPKTIAVPEYSIELEDRTRKQEDEGDGAVLSGSLHAWLSWNGKRQKVLEVPIDFKFSRIMAGDLSAGFYPPAFSPSGNVVLLRAYKRFSSMRGGGDECLVARIFKWNGKALKLRSPG